jgi:hypothetical protein
MDANRFDRLIQAKRLATSRRAALLAMLAGLVTAADEAFGHHRHTRRQRRRDRRDRLQEQRKKKKKTCAKAGQGLSKKRKQCCKGLVQDVSGLCNPPSAPSPPPPPPSCPTGQTLCGQACVDLQGDRVNCGACGVACTAGLACEAGICCLPATANLQEAIDAASARATLRLCAGTWTVGSTITIGKNLTLVGAGTGQSVLNGNHAVHVLDTAAGVEVTLRDLTIANGLAADAASLRRGGGIHNQGTLRLAGVAVIGSSAKDYGGGIFNAVGATMTLLAGSTVGGDSADEANTANRGGGIYNNGGAVTLSDGSRVSGNAATTLGGGIFNDFAGILTLQAGSTVGGHRSGEANTATNGGGLANNGGTVTLQDGSRVVGNAASSGGGIYNAYGPGSVSLATGAIFCDNLPLATQCAGTFAGPGTCPNPADGTCDD